MKTIEVHHANVSGLGALEFSNGVMEQLNNVGELKIRKVYLNKSDSVPKFASNLDIIYVGYLFGVLSRLWEIFFWKMFREQKSELLVLGDLPLNTKVRQYVLCHQSLMFKSFSLISLNFYKFSLFRFIFRRFLKKNDVVIVQSKGMASKVRAHIGRDADVRIIDLRSKYFGWPEFRRSTRVHRKNNSERIKLFYP